MTLSLLLLLTEISFRSTLRKFSKRGNSRSIKNSFMFLSVIIPAYNESERIGATLGSVLTYLAKQNYESEVIVVDDGSTDKTSETVKKYLAEFPTLKLLSYEKNSGKGFAVRYGMI